MRLTDTLPAGVTFGSATAGCDESGGTLICDLSPIDPGSTAMVTVTLTVDPETEGTIINTASVAGIEIYKGTASVPPEFRGPLTPCAAIVLWTRDPSLP